MTGRLPPNQSESVGRVARQTTAHRNFPIGVAVESLVTIAAAIGLHSNCAKEKLFNRSAKARLRDVAATATGTEPLRCWADYLHCVNSPGLFCYCTFLFRLLTEFWTRTGCLWALSARKARLKRFSIRSLSDTFRSVFCDRLATEIALKTSFMH